MKGIIAVVFLLFVVAGMAHGQEDKYYLLIEKNAGHWDFITISLNKPLWEKKSQEILEINRITGNDFIPSYEETSEWKYLGNFSFKRFSDEPSLVSKITYSCKMRSNKTKYTPCNSALTGFINTDFFGIGGSSRFSLQSKKLVELIKEANLMSEVKACRGKNLAFAEDALNNRVTYEPKVVDMSGNYDKSKIYEVVPDNYDCLIANTNEIKYVINTNPIYNVEIEQPTFNICKDGTKCTVSSQIKILSKNIQGLTVNDVFADDSLSLKLNRILLNKQNMLTVDVSINNKSRNIIKVEGISLYIDDVIYKMPPQNFPIEFEPKQTVKDKISSYVDMNLNPNKVNYAIDKKNEFNKLSIGIAVKYTLDGVQKTLFDSKEYTLKKLSVSI